MINYIKQLFTGEFDAGEYCNFNSSAAQAVAGKDILLAIWNATGTQILAVAGQKSLTINRDADSIEVSTKDTVGGWKSFIGGMKEWSIESEGLFVNGDSSHQILSQAFVNGDLVCVKVYNNKTRVGMYGGLAAVTSYPLEAPYDDAMTYKITLAGNGPLVDFSVNPPEHDTLPSTTEVDVNLASLTIGTLHLSPAFAPSRTNYVATATNAADAVTAITSDSSATVAITYNNGTITNGSDATWSTGTKNLEVTVTKGQKTKKYTVAVTKA